MKRSKKKGIISVVLVLCCTLVIFQSCETESLLNPDFRTGVQGYYFLEKLNNQNQISFYSKLNQNTEAIRLNNGGTPLTIDQINFIEVRDSVLFTTDQQANTIRSFDHINKNLTTEFSNVAVNPNSFLFTISNTDSLLFISDVGASDTVPKINIYNFNKKENVQQINLNYQADQMAIFDGRIFVFPSETTPNDTNTVAIILGKNTETGVFETASLRLGINPFQAVAMGTDSLVVACQGSFLDTNTTGASLYVIKKDAEGNIVSQLFKQFNQKGKPRIVSISNNQLIYSFQTTQLIENTSEGINESLFLEQSYDLFYYDIIEKELLGVRKENTLNFIDRIDPTSKQILGSIQTQGVVKQIVLL